APQNDAIKQGDDWLAANVPAILNSGAYADGGLVLVTWDESEGGDFPIGMIALSRNATAGRASTVGYTHSSTLLSLQLLFGVTPLLGDAANATPLSDLLGVFP